MLKEIGSDCIDVVRCVNIMVIPAFHLLLKNVKLSSSCYLSRAERVV